MYFLKNSFNLFFVESVDAEDCSHTQTADIYQVHSLTVFHKLNLHV